VKANRVISKAALVAILACATPAACRWAGSRTAPVALEILAINDFHGNLEAPAGGNPRLRGVEAGGIEYLATHLRNAVASSRNAAIVSAGDLIGATPLLSSAFHDQPTIEAMNLLGLSMTAAGNHEFDEGTEELLRMQNGGCHPRDGCPAGPFGGASFQFLTANVVRKATGATLFPPYALREFGGVKVAFVGLTLQSTPTIVPATAAAGLDFRDEAGAVNDLVPQLAAQGVKAIVVLIHEGGVAAGGINECPGISGPIVDIVKRTSKEVDLFISGHTHQAYVCTIDGRPVTSSLSEGRVFAEIHAQLDPSTNDFKPGSFAINNRIVTRTVPKAADMTALIERYRPLVAPIANKVVGAIARDVTRTATPAGESALGRLIADAQLAATQPARLGGAKLAFMNGGGLRSDLLYAQVSAGEPAGAVTYGEAFAVQPFGNTLTTITLSGRQIKEALEQQFDNPAAGRHRILQVSDGFSYNYDTRLPRGGKVDAASMRLHGATVDLNAAYRVTVNSFLADGGDNFTVFVGGTDRLAGIVDIEALASYMSAAAAPISPSSPNRIRRIDLSPQDARQRKNFRSKSRTPVR
jgi:5'-nucleotidase